MPDDASEGQEDRAARVQRDDRVRDRVQCLMRGLTPKRPPSPHFSWAEVNARSGYSYLPLGRTAIGNGRIVVFFFGKNIRAFH